VLPSYTTEEAPLVIGKVLIWLVDRLFGLRYQYFGFREGNYLKVKRGAAEIVDLEDVPPKYHADRGPIEYDDLALLESASRAKQLAGSSRYSVLKSLDPFVVLESVFRRVPGTAIDPSRRRGIDLSASTAGGESAGDRGRSRTTSVTHAVCS